MTNEQMRAIMGNNIRSIRLKHHLKKEEFSEMLGITTSFLSAVERGDRGFTMAILYKLADILNLSTDIFFKHDRSVSFDEHTALRKKIYAFTGNLNKRELNLITTIAREIHHIYYSDTSDKTLIGQNLKEDTNGTIQFS